MDDARLGDSQDLSKRSFLKMTGLGAAAAALFGASPTALGQGNGNGQGSGLGQGNGIAQQAGELLPLITGGAYLAGLGFAIFAVLKFKAHKDNPTGGGINWDFVQIWWDALDNATRIALTDLGYTPDVVTDGITALDNGEPDFILGLIEDLEMVLD